MAPGRLSALAGLVALLACCCGAARAYEFDMVFQTKCINEDSTLGQEITGGYVAYRKEDPDLMVPMDVKIEDPKGAVVYQSKAKTSDGFRFTSKHDGEYKLCFSAKGALARPAERGKEEQREGKRTRRTWETDMARKVIRGKTGWAVFPQAWSLVQCLRRANERPMRGWTAERVREGANRDRRWAGCSGGKR